MQLIVKVVSARGLGTPSPFESFPYACVEWQGESYYTEVSLNSQTPIWQRGNFVLFFEEYLRNEAITISLYNYDPTGEGKDEFLGSAVVDLYSALPFDVDEDDDTTHRRKSKRPFNREFDDLILLEGGRSNNAVVHVQMSIQPTSTDVFGLRSTSQHSGLLADAESPDSVTVNATFEAEDTSGDKYGSAILDDKSPYVRIEVLQAKHLRKRRKSLLALPQNANMLGLSPNVYCFFYHNGVPYSTSIVQNSRFPKWVDQIFSIPITDELDLEEHLTFNLRDYNDEYELDLGSLGSAFLDLCSLDPGVEVTKKLPIDDSHNSMLVIKCCMYGETKRCKRLIKMAKKARRQETKNQLETNVDVQAVDESTVNREVEALREAQRKSVESTYSVADRIADLPTSDVKKQSSMSQKSDVTEIWYNNSFDDHALDSHFNDATREQLPSFGLESRDINEDKFFDDARDTEAYSNYPSRPSTYLDREAGKIAHLSTSEQEDDRNLLRRVQSKIRETPSPSRQRASVAIATTIDADSAIPLQHDRPFGKETDSTAYPIQLPAFDDNPLGAEKFNDFIQLGDNNEGGLRNIRDSIGERRPSLMELEARERKTSAYHSVDEELVTDVYNSQHLPGRLDVLERAENNAVPRFKDRRTSVTTPSKNDVDSSAPFMKGGLRSAYPRIPPDEKTVTTDFEAVYDTYDEQGSDKKLSAEDDDKRVSSIRMKRGKGANKKYKIAEEKEEAELEFYGSAAQAMHKFPTAHYKLHSEFPVSSEDSTEKHRRGQTQYKNNNKEARLDKLISRISSVLPTVPKADIEEAVKHVDAKFRNKKNQHSYRNEDDDNDEIVDSAIRRISEKMVVASYLPTKATLSEDSHFSKSFSMFLSNPNSHSRPVGVDYKYQGIHSVKDSVLKHGDTFIQPSGRKKALLIGCSYHGTPHLKNLFTTLTDLSTIQLLVTASMKVPSTEEHITILRPNLIGVNHNIEEEEDEDDDTIRRHKSIEAMPFHIPTKDNICLGMDWLAAGAQPGDILVFYFSGYRTMSKKKSFSVMVAEDAKEITKEDMYNHLQKKLPEGCRLTCLYDYYEFHHVSDDDRERQRIIEAVANATTPLHVSADVKTLSIAAMDKDLNKTRAPLALSLASIVAQHSPETIDNITSEHLIDKLSNAAIMRGFKDAYPIIGSSQSILYSQPFGLRDSTIMLNKKVSPLDGDIDEAPVFPQNPLTPRHGYGTPNFPKNNTIEHVLSPKATRTTKPLEQLASHVPGPFASSSSHLQEHINSHQPINVKSTTDHSYNESNKKTPSQSSLPSIMPSSGIVHYHHVLTKVSKPSSPLLISSPSVPYYQKTLTPVHHHHVVTTIRNNTAGAYYPRQQIRFH